MSEMRAILVEATTRLMASACDPALIAAAERGIFPAALWQAFADAGLTTATVAANKGGAGADLGDAMAILRVAGSCAAPVPLAETMLAAWLLSESGLAVPPGPLTIAPVVRGDALRLTQARGGSRLDGSARFVPWASDCAAIVVVAQVERGSCVMLVPATHAAMTKGRNLAGEPRDELRFDHVMLAAEHVAPAGPGIDADALWRRGALARIAQMAGALEEVLALTIRYAGEREQFGRPIARFQAVQQQAALLAAETAAAGAAADAAIAAAERGDATCEIAAAKSRINEAAGIAAAIAHQVHGAMGFTREHRLNFLTRRLWSWREEFGDESYWWSRLGLAAAAIGGDALWAYLTDPDKPAKVTL